MVWIIVLTVLALGLLGTIYSQDRRENLRAAVLNVLGSRPGSTGDDVAWLVEGQLNRRVSIAEAYGMLVQLRDEGLVVSEYQRLEGGFSEHRVKDGLPAVWRLVDKGASDGGVQV